MKRKLGLNDKRENSMTYFRPHDAGIDSETEEACKRLKLKPEFRVVALDRTHDYNEALAARAGKIYDVYFYDYRREVHLCEITPSYELYYIESFAENGLEHTDNLEQLSEQLKEANSEAPDVVYIHCSSLDRLSYPSEHHRLLEDFANPTEAELSMTYEEAKEENLEYVRCNGGLWAGKTTIHEKS